MRTIFFLVDVCDRRMLDWGKMAVISLKLLSHE
jgi:hypothetical protein